MRDILGRVIHNGDAVICVGSENYNEVEIGVADGDVVRTLKYHKNPKDVFLLEHPSHTDTLVINKIKQSIEKRKQDELEKCKNMFQADEVGNIYNCTNGIYLYMGKGKLDSAAYVDTIKEDGTVEETELHKRVDEGHIYIRIVNYRDNMSMDDVRKMIIEAKYYGRLYLRVLQNTKQANKVLGSIDLEDLDKKLSLNTKQFRMEMTLN